MPLIVIAALLTDRLLGEPARFHPLSGFGNLAKFVEARLYRKSRIFGALSLLIVVLPFVALAWTVDAAGLPGAIVSVLVLYFAIAPRSLIEHARRVADDFARGDLIAARLSAGRMVSRDTVALDEAGVARAAVESVLENGNDAIFGALFWFAVAGLPGVLLYRLCNTLDAMWGYRNQRYNEFGWAAARLDDLLNYIPARLTALSYSLVGDAGSALKCWRAQAPLWDSPNAGPVMAAGAGALRIRLGGAASYGGTQEPRPVLGCGEDATRADIERAVRLVQRTLWLWAFAMFVVAAYHA